MTETVDKATKWTSGPWVYRMREPSEPGAIRDFADIDTADGMPVTVASFYSEDEQNEADARLIAKAPEMVESLRDEQLFLRALGYLLNSPLEGSLDVYEALLAWSLRARSLLNEIDPEG